MTEYGIFSEAAGGFIYGPCCSTAEAQSERKRLIAEDGEEAEDLTIKAICPDHEDEPKDSCEECFANEPDGDADPEDDEDY